VTGRNFKAISPRSKIRSEMTQAKMGRPMKNRDMFTSD
jgi:hypothetical protein